MRKLNRYKVTIAGLDAKEAELLDTFMAALTGRYYDGDCNYDNLTAKEYNSLKRCLKQFPQADVSEEKSVVTM